jgi:predicted nucleotidyltransferase
MTVDPWRSLTDKQRVVARSFLSARDAERTHLVIYLSGAHAYGFPSPDSDLDLKCVHIAPTHELVGLTPPAESEGDRIEVIDGVELDYGSNELAPVLRGAIKGNGNFLERILGELALGGSELLASAREVVRPLLSRRCAKHYGGFATSQLKLFDERPSAKRALYVLRTAATGRCVLARGDVITDVAQLREFVPPEIDELIAIKQQGERVQLDAARVATWRERLVAAIAAIDAAWPSSVLPPDPPDAAIAAVDAWLREVRRAHW